MKKTTSIYILLVYSICFMLSLAGCFEKKAGESIPTDKQQVMLSEVINQLSRYDNKKILIKGNYGPMCGSGCCSDFYLQQGISSIKVQVSNIELPGYNAGVPILVYGILKTTKGSPYIKALGLEVVK